MSDPDGLRAGVEKLIAEWEKEEAAAKSSASEAARMHFSGGSFERHMAVAKSAKSHADELRALLAKHPPTPPADRSRPMVESAPDRSEPIRRDLARLLDSLYGLHLRPGHIDAVLDVFHLHSPVKDGGWWCSQCERWVVRPPRVKAHA